MQSNDSEMWRAIGALTELVMDSMEDADIGPRIAVGESPGVLWDIERAVTCGPKYNNDNRHMPPLGKFEKVAKFCLM